LSARRQRCAFLFPGSRPSQRAGTSSKNTPSRSSRATTSRPRNLHPSTSVKIEYSGQDWTRSKKMQSKWRAMEVTAAILNGRRL
jgi:hypothetical protein